MRSLAEISRINTLAEIAKQQFLAKALNNPKDFHPRKPKLGGRVTIGLSQKPAKDEPDYDDRKNWGANS